MFCVGFMKKNEEKKENTVCHQINISVTLHIGLPPWSLKKRHLARTRNVLFPSKQFISGLVLNGLYFIEINRV